MADFLSRLVERTNGLIQVAEPLITPSFTAGPASIMDYAESPAFDIRPGPHHGASWQGEPHLQRSMTVKHADFNAGIIGEISNNQAKNSPFDVTGTQAISGHGQSGFGVPAGTMPEKTAFGKDITDVTQQMPADAIWVNEKTNFHPQPTPIIREMPGDDELVFPQEAHTEPDGEKTIYYPKSMIHEIPGGDEPGITENIHAEHARNGEKTVYHPQRLIHEISGDDRPVFAEDIHVEHARNGEKSINRPQPKSMISETPVKDENSSESTRAGIMAAESLHQPERSLKITGMPEDKAAGNLKKALTENIRTLKDTSGSNPAHLHKPDRKFQKIGTGNQSEFQVAAGDEIPEMIDPVDSTEKKPAKRVYRNVTKPGNELQIQVPKFSKQGTLFSERRREIQESPDSAAIAGIPVPGKKLYQDAGTAAYRPPAEKQKRVAESHTEIKVTIGRVEIRSSAPPAHPGVPSRQNPALSLNDYLKKRNRNTL